MDLNKTTEQRREELAQLAESKGIPNLAKALRSEDLAKTIKDIQDFDGWIRVATSLPTNRDMVLVTNGKDVWMGDYSPKANVWFVVYDGAPTVNVNEIIAWMYMPSIPPELLNNQSNDKS